MSHPGANLWSWARHGRHTIEVHGSKHGRDGSVRGLRGASARPTTTSSSARAAGSSTDHGELAGGWQRAAARPPAAPAAPGGASRAPRVLASAKRLSASTSASGSTTDDHAARGREPGSPAARPRPGGSSSIAHESRRRAVHEPRPAPAVGAPAPHPTVVGRGGAHRGARCVEAEQPAHPHADLAVVDLHAAVLGHDPEQDHGAVQRR